MCYKRAMRNATLLCAACVVSCGSGEAENCTVVERGESAAVVCPDGSEVVVEDGVDGVDGEDGTDGRDGVDGRNGVDGVDNHIAATHTCTGSLEATPCYFIYQVSVMTSGDVFAYGGVWGCFLMQAGASAYYAASQVGSATAVVIFQQDVTGSMNGGFWMISLDRTFGATTIVYTDPDVSGGSDTWTMPAAACTVNIYP